MDIRTENIDELNAVIKLKIEKDDYEEKVNKVLKDYKKRANMPGFRPGKVPDGIIRKLYRKPVLAEEINKMVSESLFQYIQENDIHILGEPLPSEKEENKIDFDNTEVFEFAFDLGLAPEFDFELSSKDKIPYYQVKVEDKQVDEYIDRVINQFGSLKEIDEVKEKSIINCNLFQLDENGKVKEDGFSAEDTTLSVEIIKDEKIKKDFLGKKVGDVIVFDIRQAYPNDTEISGLLKLEEKEKAAEIGGNFQCVIEKIEDFEKAELNQELFDKVYGEGAVSSEKEFKEKVEEELKKNYERDSEYRFGIDAKEEILKKVKFDLPVEFLKRWLLETNKNKFDKEQLDKEFPNFENDLKWQMITDKIVRDNDIKVEKEEALEYAKNMARMQFYQYGLREIPGEHLDNYANQILENKEQRKQIYTRLYEVKTLKHIKDSVKLEEKEITLEKFNKLFEK
ncbi:MAG: trigger factor [Bacteroidota bacterium]